MHLKKQLGRKRSRFVLLAPLDQTTPRILKPYQGLIDSTLDDNKLLLQVQELTATLLNKNRKKEETLEQTDTALTRPATVESENSSGIPELRTETETVQVQNDISAASELPLPLPPAAEASPEDEGITYPPRQRLKVYSDFNTSFDSAVSSTPEPEKLEQAAVPPSAQEWNVESIDTARAKPVRSKRVKRLFWLTLFVIAVAALTYFQQRMALNKIEPTAKKASSPVVTATPMKPISTVPPKVAPQPVQTKDAAATTTPAVLPEQKGAVSDEHDKISDKAVISAITKQREKKTAPPPKPVVPAKPATPPKPEKPPVFRLTTLPSFVPTKGVNKKYAEENPGWELYTGKVTEFKILWKNKAIKAIQVMDSGGMGISEAFMLKEFKEVTGGNMKLSPLTSEKRDGFEIQRGSIAENIKVVYYRDEQEGKLQAFVLTWQ
ncbi:MAG: hypothetical protein PHU01_11630, partial [Desulfuromonadaceae bacterium]|nr:hypothetical protein [Desulfuromonadaceae bacterium]